MDDTRGSVPPDELKRELAAKQRMVGADLRKTSSVPGAMFDACDPIVEAHLLDDDVVRKLLNQLNSLDQSRSAKKLAHSPPLDVGERNRVHPGEIEEFFATLRNAGQAEPPSLEENLAQERRWILIDLVKNGAGVARQRATQELRETMADIAKWEGFDLQLLERLIIGLEAESTTGAPVLFEALRIAASRAIKQLELEQHGEDSP